MNHSIKIVAQGTGWTEFVVNGYQAIAFTRGGVVASGSSNDGRSKVPDYVKNAARKIKGGR